MVVGVDGRTISIPKGYVKPLNREQNDSGLQVLRERYESDSSTWITVPA